MHSSWSHTWSCCHTYTLQATSIMRGHVLKNTQTHTGKHSRNTQDQINVFSFLSLLQWKHTRHFRWEINCVASAVHASLRNATPTSPPRQIAFLSISSVLPMGRQFHQQAKQEIWQLLRGSLLINYHLRNKLWRLCCFQSLHGNKQRNTLSVITQEIVKANSSRG